MPTPRDDGPRAHRVRIAVVSIVVGVVLQGPELLLAQHDLGALLIGAAAGGLLLLRRPRGRGATALGAGAALVIGVAGFVLANVLPPPYIVRYPPGGVPSLSNTLSTVYTVLIVAGGAAALVLTARHLQLTLATRSRSR